MRGLRAFAVAMYIVVLCAIAVMASTMSTVNASRLADNDFELLKSEATSYVDGSFMGLTNISISDLVISPEHTRGWARKGEHHVTVSVKVTNIGTEAETYKVLLEVRRTDEGQAKDVKIKPSPSQEVTLEVEQSKVVNFDMELLWSGGYIAQVGELSEAFIIEDRAGTITGIFGGVLGLSATVGVVLTLRAYRRMIKT